MAALFCTKQSSISAAACGTEEHVLNLEKYWLHNGCIGYDLVILHFMVAAHAYGYICIISSVLLF